MKTNKWHAIFDFCVLVLDGAARKLDPYVPGGMDYVKINVILFCIILPALLGVSIGLNVLWLIQTILHHSQWLVEVLQVFV